MQHAQTITQGQTDALARATQGASFLNYPAIIQGFIEKGIAPADITPRVNVFTFNAWKAKGRSVKKGEKGVRVVTFVERAKQLDNGESIVSRFPSTTVVFHVSQTEVRS